ncbi:MAG: YibE/F family protein [Candidatus Magasanikbacteria bacterium]|nr:YibE/F family protein [Candidatus Magasanikbacteria bacterium]
MKKFIILAIFAITICLPSLVIANSQPNQPPVPDEYFRAKVNAILEEGQKEIDGSIQDYQELSLTILNGVLKDTKITIDHGGLFQIEENQRVSTGDIVVITKTMKPDGEPLYYIIDKDRRTGLITATAIFLALAIFFGRKRGLTSIIGLFLTVVVIFYGVIPRIAAGGSPFWTSLLGAFAILITSLYLSHGINKRTTVALISSLVSLAIAVGLDFLFVFLANLNGSGAEEAMYLQFDNTVFDLRQLLLGAIILGVLGVLDDVTTGQSATVDEVYKANPNLSKKELYASGMSVGREHIASLINTLVLAYVGAAFPLLIFFTTQKNLPLWVIINGSFLAEEIIRTLVGSATLVIAVPITTLIAVNIYTRKKPKQA